jgi:hypothetical protein
MTPARFAILSALCALAARPAAAECPPQWLSDGGIAGVNGTVYTATTWDPDGPGPLPPKLILAGSFSFAGTEATGNIAAWDGTSWSSFSTGSDGTIYALAIFNGAPVIGGYFVNAGGVACNGVARWNTATGAWEPMNANLGGNPPGIAAFAIWRGDLYAVGGFSVSPGSGSANIARWDTTLAAWQPLGLGIHGGFNAENVTSLAVVGDELFVGGVFNSADGVSVSNIARWNGTTFQPVGAGVDGTVVSMAALNNQLIVGGNFTHAGGNPSSGIARWNGANWDDPTSGQTLGIGALAVIDGELFAGGSFPQGTSSWSGFARLQNGGWINQSLSGVTSWDSLHAICSFNNTTIVGGNFSGGNPANPSNVAQYAGNGPQPLGVNAFTFVNNGSQGSSPVLSFATYRDQLIMGGTFQAPTGASAGIVAAWDGNSWQPLGAGPGQGQISVNALTVFNSNLVAGGVFNGAGTNIARFDGTNWSNFGSGLNGLVTSLAVYNNDLIAAGAFTLSGSTQVLRVARWNGAAWSPLGSGFPTAQVNALTVYNGNLYACSDSLLLSGVTNSYIVFWNGTTWQRAGTGLSGGIPGARALAVYNNELYVSGNFTMAGGLTANHIARWNGSAWNPVGAGLMYPPFAMTVYNQTLVTGANVLGGGDWVHRWNGSAWSSLGVFANGSVTALGSYKGELIAGGGFTAIGGKVSRYWARWTDTNTPWVALQPVPGCGPNESLFITAAPGFGPLAYAWSRNGAPLSDGPTPSGASVAGSTTSHLAIVNGSRADGGTFTCTVTSACASSTSNPVSLLFCPADFNCSGGVEIQDIFDFLNAWLAADSRADFNGVNGLDSQDIFDFLNAWFAGCS